MTDLATTLNAIRAHRPCRDGWKKLMSHLGKTRTDDEPVHVLTVLESNGLDDALWCLRAVEGQERLIRHLACDFAEHVLPIFEREILDDKRPRKAIETARLYADGKATHTELVAAGDAAKAAAGDAAWDAAWAAAGDAAWAAAGDAEQEWQAARLRLYCEQGEAAIGTPLEMEPAND